MQPDPILDETRRAREELAAPFGENIHAFFEYIRERERLSDRPSVTLQPNAPEPVAKTW
jgi:hypothetical protein